MKSNPRAVAGVLLLLSAGLATSLEAQSFREWKLRGEVTAPRARFVALPLSPEVLDGCESDELADLRLADSGGTEVPFGVVREREIREEVEVDGRILDRESPSPELSRVTIDFAESIVKNSLTVATAGQNFRRSVRVEGSADQTAWADILAQGWIFAVPPDRRFETLDIGPSTHRFLRLTVARMPEEREAPAIESVRCRRVVVVKPQESEVEPVLESLSSSPETRQSELKLDFRRRHLPISRLRLVLASDPQRVFLRQCTVFGRNSLSRMARVRFETEEYGAEREVETPWEQLGSGVVFRDANGEGSLEIKVEGGARYVRIVVENGDSPALDLAGAVGVVSPVYAVFEPAGQSGFTLYCGHAQARAPRYESAATLAAVDLRTAPRAEILSLDAQPQAVTKALPSGQTAVWVFMAATVVATLALLWHAATRTRPGSAHTEGAL